MRKDRVSGVYSTGRKKGQNASEVSPRRVPQTTHNFDNGYGAGLSDKSESTQGKAPLPASFRAAAALSADQEKSSVCYTSAQAASTSTILRWNACPSLSNRWQ